ncbi:MAG: helix-turn-helix domain-containing protein [Rhizobiaceae bacterium]|nr:helix-turn-helix domain-containing protein [Rhizobiaceae bacterium]
MTPFGLKMRELRNEKGVNQKQMAKDLGVSAAYLSALEHGHRGVPSWQFLQRVIGYFNIIWDEAEEFQRLAATSASRVVVDTVDLSVEATILANSVSRNISKLSPEECLEIEAQIQMMSETNRLTSEE